MEYVIWGIPPGEADEQILYTKAKTSEQAETAKRIIEGPKFNATCVRIQQLDLSKDDLAGRFLLR